MFARNTFKLYCVISLMCLSVSQAKGQSNFSVLSPIRIAQANEPAPEASVVPPAADATAEAGGDAGDTPADRKIDPSRRFGEERPPILPPITYLRNEAVLLKQGQHMLDLGAVYTVNQYNFPVVVPPGAVTNASVQDRNMYVPFALRYGLTDSLQAQVFVPVGFSSEQFDVIPNDTRSSTTGPIGDTIVSLNYSLPQCMTGEYNIVWTNFLSIPTGKPHDLYALPDSQFGKGWFEYGSSLLAIRRYDPLLVFGGAGIRYTFNSEISGQDVHRGFCVDYQYGVGFGVNEQTSLSCKLFGSYEPALQINNHVLTGSQRDLVALRFAITRAEDRRIYEPFVTVGCTQQANDVQLGVVVTFR
ncbi:hypothetical protein [Schlesneria paludicola]|uniref:hypothetical protein n=1 Tax=Schlesneria paludicola TaxID=360056 RepID=UPI0012FC0052|nr:hypothetical protein [Schlesneria paludicola]